MKNPVISLLILPLTLLASCTSEPDLADAPRWAINWAEVTPAQSGLEGFQVWELFVDGWEKSHDPAYFKCYIVRSLDGEVTSPPRDCTGCNWAYSLEFEQYNEAAGSATEGTPCDATLQADERFLGPLSYGIGQLPSDLQEDEPYPGRTTGWYIGWDGQSADAFGYAYAKALESGGTPKGPGWLNGETYILWPAYAWDLED